MLVYLFELDSQIRDEKRCNIGFNKLFRELFINGNTVVLSINQLTDSVILYNLIKQNDTYNILLELFKKGVLKINLYSDITSVSMYVQRAIDKILLGTSSFIFANLPIKSDNITALETIKKALVFSDLSFINEQNFNSVDIDYIKKFINIVLLLSLEEKPKHHKQEVQGLTFDKIFNKLKHQINTSNELNNRDTYSTFTSTLNIIESISPLVKDSTATAISSNRSDWFNTIESSNYTTLEKNICYEMINLFYNFTVQDNINNISYSYDTSNEYSFFEEFFNIFEKNLRLIDDISMVRVIDLDYIPEYKFYNLNWNVILRFINNDTKEDLQFNCIYNDCIKQNQRNTLISFSKKTSLNFGYFILHVLVFVLAQYVLSNLSVESIKDNIPNEFFKLSFEIITLGIISSITSKIFRVPDILDSMHNFFITIYDFNYYLYIKYKKQNY